MSGSFFTGWYGGPTIPEYNTVKDIPSSQLVYSSKWFTTPVSAPLDTTCYFQIYGDYFQALVKAANSGSQKFSRNSKKYNLF